MLTFPSKFATELAKDKNSPALLVKLENGLLYNDQSTQQDWAANSQAYQVDITTQSGSVIIVSTTRPENFTGGSWVWLGSIGSLEDFGSTNYTWQSFKQNTGSPKSLYTVKGYFKEYEFSGATICCELWMAGKGSKIGTTVSVTIGRTLGSEVEFDFTSQGITIASGVEYWLKFYGTFGAPLQYYTTSNTYPLGQFDYTWYYGKQETNLGDLYFEVTLSGGYYKTTGYIRTQTMDMGEIPASTGEWVLSDLQPAGTSIAYQAWASDTGVFAGEETNLGTIADGDAITTLKRYYRVKATLNASSDESLTPQVQSIRAEFPSFLTLSNRHGFGYEPSILSVSALSTTIDTFDKSSIGQTSIEIDLTPTVSNWMATDRPKNKRVKVLAGFVADGFMEADFIDYAYGLVDSWPISQENRITLNLKDVSKEWEADVPAVWEDTADDVIWAATPHVDVMLDILKNHVNVRDSTLLLSSFQGVKAALPGWRVSRTITGGTEAADDLLDELRILTSTFFIPQPDGRIKLKRWDPTEAAVDSLTDDNCISLEWDPNAGALLNYTPVYFGWDGDGEDEEDFAALTIGVDATSQDEWGEVAEKKIMDKWTPFTRSAQIDDLINKVIKRYGGIPSLIKAEVGLQKMGLEVGDIVTVTTKRAPSNDMQGILNVKFQVVSRELNYEEHKVSLTLLECATSINNQVGEMVVKQTAQDPPEHVTDLSVVEDIYMGPDGSWVSRLTITYTPPADEFWDGALMYIKVGAGGTYKSLGKDTSAGNGFVTDAGLAGYQVGDTVYLRAVSVNYNGISADINTAEEVSLVTLGKYAPPSNVTGFTYAIEGSGIKFSWNHIPDADSWGYEIRLGSSWDAGTKIVDGVVKNSYFWQPPQETSGTITFWIKAIDTSGIYSNTATSLSITIYLPIVPSFTSQVVDNFVLLYWQGHQGTFPIDYYEIRRGGASWEDADIIGELNASFSTVFETSAGTYTYRIKAVDTAGLISAEKTVTSVVNQPPDYQLNADDDDMFSGMKTNIVEERLIQYHVVNEGTVNVTNGSPVVSGNDVSWLNDITVGDKFKLNGESSEYTILSVDSDAQLTLASNYAGGTATMKGYTIGVQYVRKFYACANTTQTFDEYSATLPGTTMQDFVEAGTPDYTYLIQPMLTSASYERVMNYGATLSGSMITAALDKTLLLGTLTIAPTISVSKSTANLTGSMTFTKGSDTITGSGTAFTTDLSVGAYIMAATSETPYRVKAIASNESLTIERVFGEATEAGITGKKITTWTDYASVWQVFATDFKFVKVKLDFSGTGENIAGLNNLNFRLDVKIRDDMGKSSVNSGSSTTTTGSTTTSIVLNPGGGASFAVDDVIKVGVIGNSVITGVTGDTLTVSPALPSAPGSGVSVTIFGKRVYFNITYVDIVDITVSPRGTTAKTGIYDFLDGANPDHFDAFIFDKDGNSITPCDFGWSASGY